MPPAAFGCREKENMMFDVTTVEVQLGDKVLKLETGPSQPEALRLYASCGYERRGPFGKYSDDPLSVFMQKRIEG